MCRVTCVAGEDSVDEFLMFGAHVSMNTVCGHRDPAISLGVSVEDLEDVMGPA